MKAVILNSGIGSRMGDLTAQSIKCLVPLGNGETILSRQIRQFRSVGLDRMVITTGPHESLLIDSIDKTSEQNISFVNNPLYKSTNYIYSMYLAREDIVDDILLIHGDIVLSRSLLEDLLSSENPDAVLIDSTRPLPDKDFRGRLSEGRVKEISVSVTGSDCRLLMPVYKLTGSFMNTWMEKIGEFVETGRVGVYAEDALNEITGSIRLSPFDMAGRFCMEIDTPVDLEDARRKVADDI